MVDRTCVLFYPSPKGVPLTYEEDDMNPSSTTTATQMIMPGMDDASPFHSVTSGGSLSPGVEVTYRGHIKGGPSFGATGVVQEIRGRRVVVNLQGWGVWHIPFYFLSTSLKAA